MAEEVQIQGSNERGKIRNPLGVIGLGFITLGIYTVVWYYKVNKEMAQIGQARGTEECGTSPTTSLLAIIPGALIIVPPFVSMYNACKRLLATERVTGAKEGLEAPLLWLLLIFIGPIGIYLFQRDLNRALESQAGGPERPLEAPAQTAPPAAPEQPAGAQSPPPQP